MLKNTNIESEEYALFQEAQMIENNKKYGHKLQEVSVLMDKALDFKDETFIEQLQLFFEDKEVVEGLSENNEFAFMLVIMEIYNLEKNAGVKNNVFAWGQALDDVISIIRQVKFLLWEIEFLNDEESGQLLLGYLKENNISMVALEYLIYISSCDKAKVVNVLNKLF